MKFPPLNKDHTKVSDKFQVVIPKATREKIHLKRGETLVASPLKDGVVLHRSHPWSTPKFQQLESLWQDMTVEEYFKRENASWDE